MAGDDTTNMLWMYERAVWFIYSLLIFLLVAPAVAFLIRGWSNRRDQILDAFSPDSALYYLRCFHQSQAPAHERDALGMLRKVYERQFGWVPYLIPLILLGLLGASLLFLSALASTAWLRTRDLNAGVIPAQVVLAILGGYTWVANDQIERFNRDHVSAGDLYWGAFRLVISVPVAYAFSLLFKDVLALPLAFLLGTFPTSTILTFSRRAIAKYLPPLTDAPAQKQNQLEEIPAVNTFAAERFAAEGITSVCQLAYYDPVRLSIRSGYDFSYVITCIGEALLWVYLSEGKGMSAFREHGLLSAYEVKTLWEDLQERANVQDRDRAAAARIIKSLAARLAVSEEAIWNLLSQVALDPYVEFQWRAWADPFRTENEREAEGPSGPGSVPPTTGPLPQDANPRSPRGRKGAPGRDESPDPKEKKP